jgi:hypothetical protein
MFSISVSVFNATAKLLGTNFGGVMELESADR